MLNKHFHEFIELLEKKFQVLTGIDGVTFEECWIEKKEIALSNTTVPFIGIESLIKNKEASGRAKDKVDLEELRRIRAEAG